jgi:hypothetical protein
VRNKVIEKEGKREKERKKEKKKYQVCLQERDQARLFAAHLFDANG